MSTSSFSRASATVKCCFAFSRYHVSRSLLGLIIVLVEYVVLSGWFLFIRTTFILIEV